MKEMFGKERKILDFEHRDASYVCIASKSPEDVKLYFRQDLKKYNFYGMTSKDTKRFKLMEKPVLEKSCGSHNFSVQWFPHLNKYIAIAGMDDWKRNKKWRDIDDFEVFLSEFEKRFKKPYTRDEKRFKQLKKALRYPYPHADGLYLFESEDGIDFKQISDTPIITATNDGFISALDWGKSSEFDTMLNLIYNKYEDKYYFYTRANLKPGQRYIQYATSKDMKNWSKFRTIKTNPKHEPKEGEYYFPNVMMHPTENLFIGLMPYCNKELQMLRLMKSEDGVNWEIIEDFYEMDVIRIRKPKQDIFKNYHHPVIGYVFNKKENILFFYTLHNYMNFYKTKPVSLYRHKIKLDDFNKLLRIQ